MSIVFCKAQPEHASQIYDIENNTFSDPYSIGSIDDCTCSNLYSTSVVAMCGGEVVGYILATDVAGEAEIQRIAVGEKYRCRGYGGMLLEHYINSCADGGIECIHLEVRRSNLSAIRLYTRYGFEQVGERKGYYSDNGEDAVLYTKAVINC